MLSKTMIDHKGAAMFYLEIDTLVYQVGTLVNTKFNQNKGHYIYARFVLTKRNS